MNYSKRFVVEPDAKVILHKIDPGYIDPDLTEKDALAETKKLCKKLRKLQTKLYSEKQRSVLIVLQALVLRNFVGSTVDAKQVARGAAALGVCTVTQKRGNPVPVLSRTAVLAVTPSIWSVTVP
jgi:hypothetical protein